MSTRDSALNQKKAEIGEVENNQHKRLLSTNNKQTSLRLRNIRKGSLSEIKLTPYKIINNNKKMRHPIY